MLAARSPAVLDTGIETLLTSLTKIFKSLRLEINFAAGKTECMLQYRGDGAVRRLDARRIGPNGELLVAVPNSANMIHVVDSYKHLGGMIARDRSGAKDANAKARSAMAAYVPLALRVFGSEKVYFELKLTFLWALVLSRLLFNVHIVVPTARYVKVLNAVYMRVLRRMAGCCNYGEKTISDIAVRKKLQLPSLDCLLVRARLRYLGRILRRKPPALLALLGSRPKDRQLPWSSLIADDLGIVWRQVSICAKLPDPMHGSRDWVAFVSDDPKRWSSVVTTVFFYESKCDRARVMQDDPCHVRQHSCDSCAANFASQKVLEVHMRVKHGVRCLQRCYIDSNGICPVCRTNFHTRLRCLAHLCDSRRTKCWDQISANIHSFPQLSLARVTELDAVDRDSKRMASKTGHSHVLASKSALTSGGKRVGHVSL